MQYRTFRENQDQLSLLGFGCMRFPRKRGEIDLEESKRMIQTAIQLGVNYFDTAYIYPGSEAALGKILEELKCRERVFIATKLPQYMIKSKKDMDAYFKEQQKRMRTDYFDYYLMHMLPDIGSWKRLVDLGILEWIEKKKKLGQIRRIGFSYHGNSEAFCRLMDIYPWEFCQIQYNYMDEHSQAGRRGLTYAAEKGIPVVIMEPLRGGRLTNLLPIDAVNLFKSIYPERSPAEWAFRWLYNQSEVGVVLSGMNSMEMLLENIRVADETHPNSLTRKDLDFFDQIKDIINQKIKVPCTGCGYCMPCPKGVDIPGAFRCYNVSFAEGYKTGMREYLMCTTMRSNPTNASRCIGCGKCEQHCPQAIEIRKELSNVTKKLEGPIYRIIRFILHMFGRF